MTRISKRLKSLVQFVDKNDNIVDVGCDHGLLSIYLVENNLCKKVIASDVNQNALNSAINNIKSRNLNIKTVLSDGIDNVDLNDINTLVISGMGTSTILHILKDDKKLKKVKKLILQSNNDHDILREKLNNKGYYLSDEMVIFDKGKWYVTMLFIKSNKKNDGSTLKYGFLNNKEYNDYLINYRKMIFKKIPLFSVNAKFKAFKELLELKKAIGK